METIQPTNVLKSSTQNIVYRVLPVTHLLHLSTFGVFIIIIIIFCSELECPGLEKFLL